jgi:methylated-DNA-[protein]-cysteine S-methyltransferase
MKDTNNLYTVIETPFGKLHLIAENGVLKRLLLPNVSFSGEGYKLVTDAHNTPPFGKVISIIQEYSTGKPIPKEIEFDADGTPFQKKVRAELCKIPFGSTVSYGELAVRAGFPGAARAVGRVMATNPLPLLIPCHRVIGSGGELCGFGGGLELKRKLLEHEGIKLK